MRTMLRTLSMLFFVAAVVFLLVVAAAPASMSGFGYAVSLVLFAGAGLPKDARARRRLLAASFALSGITVSARMGFAANGRTLTMGTPAPGATSSRWIDRVIDEQDLAINGARALLWTSFVHDPDVPALPAVMRGAYARMRDAEGATPSPVLATYSGLEAPGANDTVELGDVSGSASEGVVVFLHGYAGSFTLPCWVLSRAALDAGFATVCPSTRWVGDWWTSDGEATLRETLAGLRRRGASRIVLAGLSNGAIGATLLAPKLHGSIDSLILISGASPEAEAPGVPVLAIQGAHDAQISASVVRAYAGRVRGRYLSLDAGHFAMLVREREAMGAVTSFLRSRSAVPAPANARTAARP